MKNLPVPTQVMRNSLCLDGDLCGAPTLDIAREFQYKLQEVLKMVGIHMRKIYSNHVEFSLDSDRDIDFAS